MINSTIFGRILSISKILVDGVETTADGVSADGKNAQYFVVRGSTGNNAIVDSNGNLVCMLKGSENIPIAQDAAGNLTSVMKGDYAGALKTIKVDTNGQMYIAMTGQSIGVNNHPSDYFKASEYPADYAKSTDIPSDYFKADESAVMKGDDSGTKRLVAVDTSGIMLSRMKGAYGSVLKDILLDDTGIMLSRMKGSFGGTLKDISLDTDGNMISVMKGDYAGALKTWKVDADGRGEMFLNDPADVWGNVNTMGLGEHAVRVHAPPLIYDKRGSVVLYDDYEHSTNRFKTAATSGSTAVRSVDTSKTGDFSLKLTTGAIASDNVYVGYYTTDIHIARIGSVVSFAPSDTIQMHSSYFTVGVTYYDGADYWVGQLRIDSKNDKLQLYNSSGGWTDIVSDLSKFGVYAGKEYWNSMKIVIDISTNKYVRALAYGVEHDISAHSIYTSGAVTTKRLYGYYGLTAVESTAQALYADNYVLTDNEPA